VVEWARRNPRIEKCSYRVGWELRGDRIEVCPRGHTLLQRIAHYAQKLDLPARWVSCADCPGHHAAQCPRCGVMVYDPPPGPDCGPP
jgi:hypothetical protein